MIDWNGLGWYYLLGLFKILELEGVREMDKWG